MNLARNLERSAFSFPDRPVVSEDLSEISYLELNARANRAATALIKLGVKPGDRIYEIPSFPLQGTQGIPDGR